MCLSPMNTYVSQTWAAGQKQYGGIFVYKKYPLRMQRIIIMYHKSEHNKRELIVKGLLLFYANILSIYKYTDVYSSRQSYHSILISFTKIGAGSRRNVWPTPLAGFSRYLQLIVMIFTQ